jgi:hypothetical protein
MDQLSADTGWQLGVDTAAVAGLVDAYEVLAYAQDPARVATDIAAHQRRVGDVQLRCALRPGLPDCGSPENLAAKLDTLDGLGVTERDFYHYGLLPMSAIDRIRSVLASR